MPRLWEQQYSRHELLRRVGRMEQAAGVRLVTLGDGVGRGVRVLEFRTGTGFEFDVVVDRSFDVGRCEMSGRPLSWLAPPGTVGPWYYEPDHWGWLAQDAAVSLEAAGNRLVGLSREQVAFLVLEMGHKPADARPLARGQAVAPRLRVRYSTSSPGLPLFIPRHKSADGESPLVSALATERSVSGVGPLPGISSRAYSMEAKAYPYQLNGAPVERVLALARPGAAEARRSKR